jgi:hypothetical protein
VIIGKYQHDFGPKPDSRRRYSGRTVELQPVSVQGQGSTLRLASDPSPESIVLGSVASMTMPEVLVSSSTGMTQHRCGHMPSTRQVLSASCGTD